MANATLAIQVLPLECDDPINAVNAAIAVIRDSGVVHEVGGMETTLEAMMSVSYSNWRRPRTAPR